ncbi:hypothetical protein [uncultured Mediterranean phage uvDeep-CGR2-AD8-C175]|nr:hypothetical protein [uncultured Mediterranean phage uvDeep-CGR2-AD8-C175]
MSSVSDYSLANQGFSAFRTELNNILGAINTTNLATSAPASLAAGSMWVDSSSSGTHTVKYYDGSDSITLFNINTSANTVDFIDSSVTTELVGDTSPQLGGNLDTNSHNILIDDAHFIGDENGLEQIIFQTTASAVNELEVTNAATGNPPILGASGETNVDLHIKPKGSGETIIGSGGAAATLTTSGTYDLVLDTNKGTNSGNITITDGANGAIDLTTNGTGAIKFNDMAYVPQQAITSSSNAVAWDAQAKSNAYHVTTENTTFSAPSNAVEGAFICLEINYNGSHTIGWNTVFEFAASTEPTTTDTDAKTDIFVFRYNGAVWQEVGRTLNLSES